MDESTINRARRRLRTPRAAAVAGIIFAVLSGTGQMLIRLSIPTDPLDTGASLAGQASAIALALHLFPFAGIAFLWFMGVVRDRLAQLEDQFFSTVFFGSGLLYLGLSFVAAADAGALLTSYTLVPVLLRNSFLIFGRLEIYQITNVYALRMSGVFMLSLATIWLRTGTMPRLLAFLTYPLALVMLLSFSLSIYFSLIFPVWVFVISVYILLENLRSRSESTGSSETL
ncbi:MAG TPA: hypothetical protein VIY29_24585 [Ktedonobacteraceae bacterium]